MQLLRHCCKQIFKREGSVRNIYECISVRFFDYAVLNWYKFLLGNDIFKSFVLLFVKRKLAVKKDLFVQSNKIFV